LEGQIDLAEADGGHVVATALHDGAAGHLGVEGRQLHRVRAVDDKAQELQHQAILPQGRRGRQRPASAAQETRESLRDWAALMLRAGWVVVRRTVRLSWSSRSMVIVSAATWTVTICQAWMRPRAIFCPATMMMPVLLARRWAVTGSAEGRGGGP